MKLKLVRIRPDYPYNLLCILGIDVGDCWLSDEFQELFEYELIQADADMERRNYQMLSLRYRQKYSFAEIAEEYHVSRQAVQKRIQKMIHRLSHSTRKGRIIRLVHEEMEKCRK